MDEVWIYIHFFFGARAPVRYDIEYGMTTMDILTELGWGEPYKAAFEARGVRTEIPGRVIEEQRGKYVVACQHGELLSTISGKMRHQALHRVDFPTVGDWVAIIADFHSGATGVLESSKLASGRNESWRSLDYVEINGSEGSFEFTTGKWNELQYGHLGGPGMKPLPVPRDFWVWPGSPRDPGVGDPLVSFRYDQTIEFVNAIREQRDCAVTFHHGARTQAVMDAAVTSAQTGKWVDV